MQEAAPLGATASPQSCPPACSSPAQHGCCHGQLQLSGDEVHCWGASQSGCCAAGFCLQSCWFFKGFFLCLSPPDSKALALCGLKLCQEWHNTPSCTQGQISVTARATHQTQPRGWRCRHGRLPSCKHLHSSRRDAEGAGTCPAVAPGAKSSALPPQGSTSANP